MRGRLGICLALCGAVLLMATPADSAPPKKKKADFKSRFEALKKNNTGLIVIKMKSTDDPAAIPSKQSGGMTLVANSRMGIYTPELLTPGDILTVVNKNMIAVRRCYKKQLKADPEWSDDLILDLAVKKTGRVAEVSVAPGRVKRTVMGKCLMRSVPKWKFPEFTGETEDGITQEVVNASFPFTFSAN